MDILQYGKAICYSGYREGQSPITKVYPSYEEVLEDLTILEKHFDYIRMYDAGEHTRITLEVIKNENINLKVLLGMDLLGEISNPNCSWGGQYSTDEIAKNVKYNQNQLNQIIELGNTYDDIILGISAGNEAVPEWNENLVSPGRVLYFVRELKQHTTVPITYCDNVNYWHNHLIEVAQEVDFISIHLYPAWLGRNVDEAIPETINDYHSIASKYPDKQVIITEAGWPTASNNHQIPWQNANQLNQLKYIERLDNWSIENEIIVFYFEAFDEPWKGSDNQLEPEKNWGFFDERRTPKAIIKTKK